MLLQAKGRQLDTIHTRTERESLLPAQRLKRLASFRLAPGVPCYRHLLASETPEALTQVIESISALTPLGYRIINATS